jgi:predicted GIY-YIG superfamily endonuclease
MSRRRATRDTHNYDLKQGKKIVYRGIAKDPERRANDHKRSGKRFTHVFIHPKVSRTTARIREKKSIESYKRNHRGKKPKYNK